MAHNECACCYLLRFAKVFFRKISLLIMILTATLCLSATYFNTFFYPKLQCLRKYSLNTQINYNGNDIGNKNVVEFCCSSAFSTTHRESISVNLNIFKSLNKNHFWENKRHKKIFNGFRRFFFLLLLSRNAQSKGLERDGEILPILSYALAQHLI